MDLGVNDNITTLYQSQQLMNRNNTTAAILVSSAPDKNSANDSIELSKVKKIGIGACSSLGVAASLMLLAKLDKSKSYSINPLKMLKGNIKNSYLARSKYKTKEIVTIGAGSILGGLAGGTILDKKENFNSKLREAIVQIANISFPIAFVEALSFCGNKFSEKLMPNWTKSSSLFKQAVTKLPAAAGAMAGLVTGMHIGNKCSNKLNEKLFHKKDDRPIKWADFSAHVDDIGVAATFIAPDNFVTKAISRVIPAALVVAGYETGTKS